MDESRHAPGGILVVDKPSGPTSRAVVNRALRWFPRRTRIGHSGTLDPLASGVLVLCIGPCTRLARYIQLMRKSYRVSLIMGATSDSDDSQGRITSVLPRPTAPARAVVLDSLGRFVGQISQIPPKYSAARCGGRRAYDLARRGHEVNLAARIVEVYGIELLSYEYPQLDLQIECGKGTYVRALARDLGSVLGCGAYVSALRRTCVGPFEASLAVTSAASKEEAWEKLLPADLALSELPAVKLDELTAVRFSLGQAVTYAGPWHDANPAVEADEVAVHDSAGSLIGVGRAAPGSVLRPLRVFTPMKQDERPGTPGRSLI